MTIGIILQYLEAHHSKERTRLSGNEMERPVLSLHGFVESLDEISFEFELSLCEEDSCAGIGETNAEVHCHQEDERVCFTFEFNNDYGNKCHVLKISFNEIDTRKQFQRRFSTAERNEDLGSSNLSSSDGSTKRFLIKVARILIFVISFQSTFTGSKSEDIKNVTISIGGSIRLDCRTSNLIEWTHQRTGQLTPDEIYMDGQGLIGDFKKDGRHSLEIGTKNLLIANITTNDAGIYRCTIKRTPNDIVVFDLAIAVSNLVCSMNPNWNDIVGENDCGIRPDIIRFNCSIGYYGNFSPSLLWQNSGQQNLIENGVKTSITAGHSMSMLSVAARLGLNGMQFVCRVKESQSNDNRLTWQYHPLNIQYFFNSTQTIKASESNKTQCTANSSQSCDYQWINDDQQRHSSIIKGSIFKPQEDVIREGIYHCRAECRIRDKTCVAIPLQTEHMMMSGSNGNDLHRLGFIIMSIVSSALTCIIVVYIFWYKLHRKHHSKSASRQEKEVNTRSGS